MEIFGTVFVIIITSFIGWQCYKALNVIDVKFDRVRLAFAMLACVVILIASAVDLVNEIFLNSSAVYLILAAVYPFIFFVIAVAWILLNVLNVVKEKKLESSGKS